MTPFLLTEPFFLLHKEHAGWRNECGAGGRTDLTLGHLSSHTDGAADGDVADSAHPKGLFS